MNIFQRIINKKRGHAFALKHYHEQIKTEYGYFFHISSEPLINILKPITPTYESPHYVSIVYFDGRIETTDTLLYPAVYLAKTPFDCCVLLSQTKFENKRLYIYKTRKRLKLKSYISTEFISFCPVSVERVGVINEPIQVFDFINNYFHTYLESFNFITEKQDKAAHLSLAYTDLFKEFNRREFIKNAKGDGWLPQVGDVSENGK